MCTPKILAARSPVQNGEMMAEIEFLRGFTLTFALAEKAILQLPGSEKLAG